ncbi:MAG: DUF2236 domain-containing protein [Proteobacteria bacterium]|nr:DUF2236 domain-containing protein [Pseudomonadota bacterium]
MTHAVPDDLLARARFEADPLADRTIADILGPWAPPQAGVSIAEAGALYADHWQRIGWVNALIAGWQDNASLDQEELPGVPEPITKALREYAAAARALPDWAEPELIARAEEIFFDQGVLSCTLLFCASLPECYVLPDLAEVLHTTGQLEQRTDWRIRSTAAMIFPVMMRGGLTTPAGGGVAQVLKVRLIHAMVRNLVLRGSPQELTAASLPALAALRASRDMNHVLFAHGWDAARGLPCNQAEQAYTLLTFGYVVLRGLRTLGLTLDARDERAVLHAWNVVGHLVGIRRELMVFEMDAAEALFARMRSRGRAELQPPDARPALAAALFGTLAGVIPLRVAKPFPQLLCRRLIGREASHDLAIDGRLPWLSTLLFTLLMALVGMVDAIGRRFSPDFSLARLVTRVLGYHLLTKLLMDQTRPLKLPGRLLGQAQGTMQGWSADRHAPGWLNAMEDRFTVAGPWMGAARS